MFPLTDEGRGEPPRRLAQVLAAHALPTERFLAPEPGHVTDLHPGLDFLGKTTT